MDTQTRDFLEPINVRLQLTCVSCRRGFKPGALGHRANVATCPHCGSENDMNDRAKPAETDPSPRISNERVAAYEPVDSLDDGELQLLPEIKRPETTCYVSSGIESLGSGDSRHSRTMHQPTYGRDPHASLYSLPQPSPPRETETPIAAMSAPQDGGSTSEGLPPRRDYPTLESILRLYRLAGYVTVGVALVMLLYRLYSIVFSSGNNLESGLVDFFQYAFMVIAGSALLTGTFFACSEGIRLAMDVQENTLAMAKAFQRRR